MSSASVVAQLYVPWEKLGPLGKQVRSSNMHPRGPETDFYWEKQKQPDSLVLLLVLIIRIRDEIRFCWRPSHPASPWNLA